MEYLSFDNLPNVVSQIFDKVANLEKLLLEQGLKSNQVESSKVIYTAQETADLLNITLPTLHKWAKDGKITKYKIGGTRIGFKATEVESLLFKVEGKRR